MLERLNRESGTTIVMVEHRVDELADRVSRVLMMDRGSIVFDGTPREAFATAGRAFGGEMPVPTSAWFPQACRIAWCLALRGGRDPVQAAGCLFVDEAIVADRSADAADDGAAGRRARRAADGPALLTGEPARLRL